MTIGGNLHRVLRVLEVALTAVLLVMLAVAIVGVGLSLATPKHFVTSEALSEQIDHVLAVFVLLELAATSIAYLRGRDALQRILEASLLAITRKLITTELGGDPLPKAGSIALLLVAVALAWWLLVRAGALRSPSVK